MKKNQTTEYPRTVRQLQKSNMCIMGISEGEESEKGIVEIVKVVMANNIPKLMTEPNHRSRKLRIPKENTKKSTPTHSNFRKSKTKKTLGISQRKKQYLTYRRTRVRITLDFSSKTMQARRERGEIKFYNISPGLEIMFNQIFAGPDISSFICS